MSNKSISILFIATVAVQILSAILFSMFSDGFYSLSDGQLFKCEDLVSSGGDDEVIMLVFAGLVFPALFRIFKMKRKASGAEAFIFIGIMGASIWIALQSSDCGEFATTMIGNRDPFLLVFFVSGLLSVLTMVKLAARP